LRKAVRSRTDGRAQPPLCRSNQPYAAFLFLSAAQAVSRRMNRTGVGNDDPTILEKLADAPN
jgi:hypothetical protein